MVYGLESNLPKEVKMLKIGGSVITKAHRGSGDGGRIFLDLSAHQTMMWSISRLASLSFSDAEGVKCPFLQPGPPAHPRGSNLNQGPASERLEHYRLRYSVASRSKGSPRMLTAHKDTGQREVPRLLKLRLTQGKLGRSRKNATEITQRWARKRL